jgi:hypothetical protein
VTLSGRDTNIHVCPKTKGFTVARPQHPQQNAAITELRAAIAQFGEDVGSKVAKARFPDIGRSTWSRFLKAAREEARNVDHATQAGVTAPVIPPAISTTGTPATSRPAVVASAAAADVDPSGVINWAHQVSAMLAQCDMLVKQSIGIDPATNAPRVRNAIVLQQSIRARAVALKLAADRESTQFGAERVTHWERQMLSEINRALGKTRSDDQRVIANRVRNAVLGVISRRQAEREFLGGDMMPKPAG